MYTNIAVMSVVGDDCNKEILLDICKLRGCEKRYGRLKVLYSTKSIPRPSVFRMQNYRRANIQRTYSSKCLIIGKTPYLELECSVQYKWLLMHIKTEDRG